MSDTSLDLDIAGRILPVDTAIARRAAALHIPNSKPINNAFIAATALVPHLTPPPPSSGSIRHHNLCGITQTFFCLVFSKKRIAFFACGRLPTAPPAPPIPPPSSASQTRAAPPRPKKTSQISTVFPPPPE